MILLKCFYSCTWSCSVSGILFHSPFTVLMTIVVLTKKDLKLFLAIARTTLLEFSVHSLLVFVVSYCYSLNICTSFFKFILKWFITKFSMALLWLQRWSFLNWATTAREWGPGPRVTAKGGELWKPETLPLSFLCRKLIQSFWWV